MEVSLGSSALLVTLVPQALGGNWAEMASRQSLAMEHDNQARVLSVSKPETRGITMIARSVTIICSALIGIFAVSSQAFAQQKTVKACEDEWRANKAENQAKGVTEKAYVAQCRAAATSPATGKSTPSAAGDKVTTPEGQKVTAPEVKSGITAKTTTQANQFSTEALAKARCPADTVVWVNLSSRIYHFAGSKDYGKTKKGAYMCEKDTAAVNFRAAKNEKHPS